MDTFLKALASLHDRISQILEYHRVDAKRAKPTDIIAHYTTWDACAKMLLNAATSPDSGLTLWAGNANCLNDPLEGKALIDFAEKYLLRSVQVGRKNTPPGSTGGASHSIPHPALLQRIVRDLPRKDWAKIVKILIDLYSPPRPSATGRHEAQGPPMSSVYLVSFCNEEDGLDLWRPYGGNGAGVCLVMPLAPAAELMKATDWTFFKILYDEQSLIRAWTLIERPLISVCKKRELLPEADRSTARDMILEELSPALHLYKDNEFQAEKEIRLMYRGTTEKPQAMDLRPYLPTPAFFLKAPNCKVVLGPKATERSSRTTVLDIWLREAFPHERPAVEISRVPYQ